jgi:hypothetical protein
MRWLLIKDLQILRRSPLLVALLVLYPVVVAVLMGATLTGGPEKPRVAFANLAGDAEISLGGRALNPTAYTERLFDAIDPIRVDTRAEAIAKVRDGEALAALVIPPTRPNASRACSRSTRASRPRSRSSTTPRTRSSAATSNRRSGRGWPMRTRR